MDRAYFIILVVLFVGISILGRVVRSLIARRRRRATMGGAPGDEDRLGKPDPAPTISSESALISGAKIPMQPGRTDSSQVRVSLRGYDSQTIDTSTNRRNRAVERIDRLPRYKRAIVWSEILSKPVSEK